MSIYMNLLNNTHWIETIQKKKNILFQIIFSIQILKAV